MWDVIHQSPQVIVLKNGKAIYNESHLDINIDKIASAIGQTANV